MLLGVQIVKYRQNVAHVCGGNTVNSDCGEWTAVGVKNGKCRYPWYCLHYLSEAVWRFYMEFWGSLPPILAPA
jgi:hypothetical protein